MKNKLLLFVVFAVLVLFVTGIQTPAQAEPAITGVSGTLEQGSAITISGSGFGVAGPNIIVFDDFEKGTLGQPIMTGAGSAQVGEWTTILGVN
ncbi:MAG: hypothetical protein HQL27_03785, partial [Candidatus Omnitrophica bacterium]|nr:hypothetical protein [Candidatus Omnitrophota bacterium]